MIGTLYYPRHIEASFNLNKFGLSWQVSHIRMSNKNVSLSTTMLTWAYIARLYRMPARGHPPHHQIISICFRGIYSLAL
jgi:hypothetical protein